MLARVEAADSLIPGGTGPAARAGGAADGAPVPGEYRIGELAREAGITVRTLRYYQERKLLPPPRRTGRIGWYSRAHLERLRLIGQLLDRGHALSGIGELLSAWEQGYDLADLLGFEQAVTAPWSAETSVRVPVAEAATALKGQLTPELLGEAIRLGYADADGDGVIRLSHRLLDATMALVDEGIPLPAILATGRALQAGLDTIASLLADLVISHAPGGPGGAPGPPDVARLAATIERLRPVARTVIDAEFGRAMDRRARVTYRDFIRQLAARDGRAGPPGPQ